MSFQGGWERVAQYGDRPEKPDPRAVDSPARYRCVRRREGRIDEDGCEWIVEHPDAEEQYARDRRLEEIWRKVREQQEQEDSDDDLDPLVVELIREIWEEEGPQAALEQLRAWRSEDGGDLDKSEPIETLREALRANIEEDKSI